MEHYPPNTYYEDVPSSIAKDDFNKELLQKISDPEEQSLLFSCYRYDKHNNCYQLNSSLSEVFTEELRSLLINLDYLKPTGFEADITKEVPSSMGIHAVYKIYPWARCIEMVKSGSADALISIFKTSEREQFLWFPSSYNVLLEIGFFCLNNDHISFDGNLQKLKNYSIGVRSSTSYGKYFDKAYYLKKSEVTYNTDIIRLVANKRVQLGIGPIEGIKFLAARMDDTYKFTFLKPSVCKDPIYTAFSKKKINRKFVEKFSKHLQAFKKTAKYKEILLKYAK
jgi:polar amino acid transport system substrate-binding protein